MRPLDRELLRLAVPALGALVAEPLYVLTDTAIVGHLGTPQLAGLSAASAVLLSGYSIFIFLAYGTTAAVSRLTGAGEPRQAAHQAVQAIWLAGGIGLALIATLLSAAGWLTALVLTKHPLLDEIIHMVELFMPRLLAYRPGVPAE